MRTFTRALLLYWGVYAVDFATSACFILFGYGAAETNQFQRSLIASPSLASLLSWASNQDVWIGIGLTGVIVLAASPSFLPKTYLGVSLVLLSLTRTYGIATNAMFILRLAFGFPIAPLLCLALIPIPAGALFRKELTEYTKSAVLNVSSR